MKTLMRALVGLAATIACAGHAAAAQSRALLVGINDYAALRKLEGARNDVAVLEQALRARGVGVVQTLLDRDASRERIFERFRALARQSQPGDLLIFTFAGHGGQERERIPGDEIDQLDEVFYLADFNVAGAGTAQRIPDNDVYALFSEVDPGVTILFVADSCHSGTMTRDPDPRAARLSTRFSDPGPLKNDALPKPTASTRGAAVADLPNVIFLASSLDSETTPELPLGGAMHGALSWHLAQMISSGQRGPEAALSAGSLSRLRQLVRQASESRQTPSVLVPVTLATRVLFGAASAAAQPAGHTAAARRPRVHLAGGDALTRKRFEARLTGVADLVADRGQAGFIVDLDAGQMVRADLADMVAETRSPESVETALQKWRAVEALKALSVRRPLEARLTSGDQRHRSGALVQVELTPGGQIGHVAALNLAGDGTAQFLGAWPIQGKATRLPAFRVTEPFGADHIVLIGAARLDTGLIESLKALNGARDAEAVARVISEAQTRTPVALGLQAIYTQP